jgi:NAD(P)-dependent dehydrogenase (short-subunit alcohol dehydrogenase family)
MIDEVSIVTGGTSGLGRAMAQRFAAEGAQVVVTGRSEERGTAVVEEIRSSGGDASFVACDLGDEASIEALAKEALARYGRITNVIMNGAATATGTGERNDGIENLDNDILEESIATNIRGLLWLFKYTLPHLVDAADLASERTSSIVTIGTSGTRNGAPGMPIYFATKAPVETMTRSLATEYGSRGVRVNCISSGLIETESEMGALTDEFRNMVLGLNALPYFGKPEDIASAALFLSSREARYITGTTLTVNGGASF